MGCANRGPGFHPEIVVQHVKTYSSTEYDVSNQAQKLRGEFGNLLQQDHMGRWGHLIGFFVKITAQFDVNATTLSAAIDGRRWYNTVTDIGLRAGGVEYFGPGLDGRRLRDCYAFRNGALLRTDPSDVADSNQTDATQDIYLHYRFGSSNPATILNGAIPLVMLDHRIDGNDVLRFTMATDLANGSGISGFTHDGYTLVELYAETMYLSRPALDAGFHLEESVFSRNQGTIEPHYSDRDTRLEYAHVREEDEDGGNMTSISSDYTGSWDIRHGAYQYAPALSTAQVQELNAVRVSEAIGSAYGAVDIADLDSVPLYAARPWTKRSQLGRAPVHFKHSTDPTNVDEYRILHRQIFEHSDEWRKEAAARMGMDDASHRPELPGANRDISSKLLPRQLVRRA